MSPSASDRVHRIRESGSDGDSPGIRVTEHLRVGQVGDEFVTFRTDSALVDGVTPVRLRVISTGPLVGTLAPSSRTEPAMPIGRDPNPGPLWPLLCASATGEQIAN